MLTAQFASICVPIDDSPAANAALEMALALVKPDGELTLVNALNVAAVVAECTSPYGGDALSALKTLEGDRRIVLDEARKRCAAAAIRSRSVFLDGPAARAVSTFIVEGNFDAVAMGTYARRGLARLFLGSTTEAVLSAAHIPVFVTPESEHSCMAFGVHSIVVGFDASEPAQSAAQWATAIARSSGAKVAFVRVLGDDADRNHDAHRLLDAACDAAARRGVEYERVVRDGDAAAAIAAIAAARAADLIVVGTHGRTGLTRLRLGSVAAGVIRRSTVPVLILPAEARPARLMQPQPPLPEAARHV